MKPKVQISWGAIRVLLSIKFLTAMGQGGTQTELLQKHTLSLLELDITLLRFSVRGGYFPQINI